MNCSSCSAPMELFARRRYYFCRHCGRFHFLDAPATDGLQILDKPHDALACSICKGKLAKALLDQAHSVEYCEGCRGVLMARATFADVVLRRRAWASATPVTPLPPDRAEFDRLIACPRCRGRMDVHPYYGPGNVVMDSCSGCDLIWLDFGELQQIVDAPGRDRGTREAPPPREVSALRVSDDDDIDHGPRGVDVLDVLKVLFS